MLRLAPTLTPERAMFPDPARIQRTLEAYRKADGRTVFVWEVGGQIVCAAGLEVNGQTAEVRHIGTREDRAGRGYGRDLLHATAAQLKLTRLTAETDDGSVDFYRRSGFEVAEAPARGGRRRFRCTLTLP